MWSETDVGHKVPVHNVQMDPGKFSRLDHAKALQEFTVIGGEQGGGDDRGVHDYQAVVAASLIWAAISAKSVGPRLSSSAVGSPLG